MLKLLLLARHYFSLTTEPVMDARCIESADWSQEFRTDIKTRKISTQHIYMYSREIKYNLIRDGRSSILCRNLKMDKAKRTESELSFNRALTWLLKIKSLRLNKPV